MNYKLNHSIEIIGSTPLDFDHSVGFHDIRPFNKIKNNLIVLHRYPLKSLGFKGDNNDKIDIDNKYSSNVKILNNEGVIDNFDLLKKKYFIESKYLNGTTEN